MDFFMAPRSPDAAAMLDPFHKPADIPRSGASYHAAIPAE
jgi:hypothetical protein